MIKCVILSQLAFACSKSTVETLDEGMTSVQDLFNINNKDTKTTLIDIVPVSLLLILN